VGVGTGISGFWAEQPCSNAVIWMGPSGQPWIFSGGATDQNEPPSKMMPAGLANGSASVHRDPETVIDNPVALIPLQAPSIPYEVSVDTIPLIAPGGWIDVGTTSSNAMNNNFESAGQAWMRVQYTRQTPFIATVELHTNGLTGPAASASVLAVNSGFDTLTVRYNPVAKLVTGYFNGMIVGTIPYDASSARFTGFEGDGTVDNFEVKASE
jgi:hypothetical protein